jgi:ribosome-binding protein aMBF1 (putative translation factor)
LLPLVGCKNFGLSLVLHTEISKMTKKSISIKFGERVREIRLSKNLSQEQLAHLADVHRTYIGMVERAEKNITLVNIEKIANALNVNIIHLLK